MRLEKWPSKDGVVMAEPPHDDAKPECEECKRLRAQLDVLLRDGIPLVLRAERDAWHTAFKELADSVGRRGERE